MTRTAARNAAARDADRAKRHPAKRRRASAADQALPGRWRNRDSSAVRRRRGAGLLATARSSFEVRSVRWGRRPDRAAPCWIVAPVRWPESGYVGRSSTARSSAVAPTAAPAAVPRAAAVPPVASVVPSEPMSGRGAGEPLLQLVVLGAELGALLLDLGHRLLLPARRLLALQPLPAQPETR